MGNGEKLMTFLGSDRLIIIELETILHFTRFDVLYCHLRVLVYILLSCSAIRWYFSETICIVSIIWILLTFSVLFLIQCWMNPTISWWHRNTLISEKPINDYIGTTIYDQWLIVDTYWWLASVQRITILVSNPSTQ